MKIEKPLKQFGEHGNEYSLEEVGDALNTLLDALTPGQSVEVTEGVKQEEVFIEPDQKDPVVLTDKKGGWVARSPSSGDRVYYILGEEKFWVKNPETLKKLGFGFHSVMTVDNEEMDKHETKDDLDLSEDVGKEEPEAKLEVEIPKEDQKKNGIDKYNI